MPPWIPLTPYKGLLILVLIFVLLEYFFGTFSETKSTFSLNSTKLTKERNFPVFGPLYKALLHKNNTFVHENKLNSSSEPGISYGYIITNPTFLHNINATKVVSVTSELPSVFELGNTTMNKSATTSSVVYCPDDISAYLHGRVPVVRSPVPTAVDLERRFSWLEVGGHWQPKNCTVLKRVAIIIPFRCRGEHLLLFLQHMHPYLKRQQLDYTLFIVEQDGNGAFNRGMLMNIGFKEALYESNFDCFIFHDVDLLPEDDRNLYTCPEQPRHMSVAVDIFKYKLPYPAIFGGVSAITKEHFEMLNGFSNSFWGWGGEDDDMSNRIRYHHLHISRYPLTIARYTMLTHKKDKPNPNRYDLLRKGQKRFEKDGLNTLKYKLIVKKKKLLYTWILVSFEQSS